MCRRSLRKQKERVASFISLGGQPVGTRGPSVGKVGGPSIAVGGSSVFIEGPSMGIGGPYVEMGGPSGCGRPSVGLGIGPLWA